MAEASSTGPNGSTRHSDDPDYVRLWSMSIGELAEIEKDANHPLHEKAKRVGYEIAAPIRSAIQVSSTPMLKQLRLGDWARDVLGASAIGLPNTVSPLHSPSSSVNAKRDLEGASSEADPRTLDIEVDVPPETSAAEAQDAIQVAANGYLEQLVTLQSKQIANQELEAKKGESREKLNRFILWGTLGAAVLTLIATVVLGMPGFIENVTQ